VTPGFGLAKGKVDEVRVSGKKAGSGSGDGNANRKQAYASAVRLPPGMRKGGSNGNL